MSKFRCGICEWLFLVFKGAQVSVGSFFLSFFFCEKRTRRAHFWEMAPQKSKGGKPDHVWDFELANPVRGEECLRGC